MTGWGTRWFRAFAREINLLPCPGCGEGDGGGDNALCPDCLARLRCFAGPRCPGCGGEPDGILALCSKCMEFVEDRIWLDAVSLFPYRDFGRELIGRFKHGFPQLARPFGAMAAHAAGAWRGECDVVVPVPLHWTRQWKRSYNQAALFAGEVARHFELPCVAALKRRAPGRKQALLGREERLLNMRRLFYCAHPRRVERLAVLLVDDVLTTGSTLHAAAEQLLAAGAVSVRVLTAARS